MSSEELKLMQDEEVRRQEREILSTGELSSWIEGIGLPRGWDQPVHQQTES